MMKAFIIVLLLFTAMSAMAAEPIKKAVPAPKPSKVQKSSPPAMSTKPKEPLDPTLDMEELVLPEKLGDLPEIPDPTFLYRVTKQVLITPSGPMVEAVDDSTVRANFSDEEIALTWSNGVELIYALTGHEPVSEQGHDQMVAAFRGCRRTSAGSVEQIIITKASLLITSAGAATLDVSVTYAAAEEEVTEPAKREITTAKTEPDTDTLFK